MDMKRLLDECRQSFAAAAAGGGGGKSGGGFLGLFKKPAAGGRDYERDCGADDDVGLTADFRLLHAHGRIVWGAIAQANEKLFAHGKRDLPANTVYSAEPHFDGVPDELADIARAVFAVKETSPDDPDVAPIAAMITDEYNRALNVPLPSKMTGGREVFFTSTWIHRRHIPTGYLAAGTFPLLVCPERTPQNMILPVRYWAPGLVETWRQVDRRVPESVKNPPPPGPTLRAVTPREYAADPVRLTEATAAEVRKIFREQNIAADGYLFVDASVEGGSFHYGLDIREGASPADWFRTDSQGIPVVVDPSTAAYLLGTTVDFVQNARGKGFVFRNPNET